MMIDGGGLIYLEASKQDACCFREGVFMICVEYTQPVYQPYKTNAPATPVGPVGL
jgi:hypothetical protein